VSRRIALLITVAYFVFPIASVEASLRNAREVEKPYSAPHGFQAGPTHGSWSLGVPYLEFKARDDERHVEFAAVDVTGLPVGIRVYLDEDLDGGYEDAGYFCGTSDRMTVRPRETIIVGVTVGICPDGSTTTVPTRGTVTASFSR